MLGRRHAGRNKHLLNNNIKLLTERIRVSGTAIGGKAAARTNKDKYGENFYRLIGAEGGRKGHTGGYHANRELARICGTIGGRMSRRGKHKLSEKERCEIRRAYEELMGVHLKAKRERADK